MITKIMLAKATLPKTMMTKIMLAKATLPKTIINKEILAETMHINPILMALLILIRMTNFKIIF